MLILAPFVAMAMGREFARPPGAMGCKLYIPWKETDIKDGMGTFIFLGTYRLRYFKFTMDTKGTCVRYIEYVQIRNCNDPQGNEMETWKKNLDS